MYDMISCKIAPPSVFFFVLFSWHGTTPQHKVWRFERCLCNKDRGKD